MILFIWIGIEVFTSFCPPDRTKATAMAKNCHNDYKMKFSGDEEFPDLSLHNNHMAKVRVPYLPSPFTLNLTLTLSLHNHYMAKVQPRSLIPIPNPYLFQQPLG